MTSIITNSGSAADGGEATNANNNTDSERLWKEAVAESNKIYDVENDHDKKHIRRLIASLLEDF